MVRKYLFYAIILAGSASSAFAQDEDSDEPVKLYPNLADTYITVVASGASEMITSTGQPVSIIGVDEIKQVQGGDVTRVLERLPGVTFSRNGGPGVFTGLRVRGADAEQLLVLVDGIRVADTASPAGGFDFGTLLPAGIGKIELLRGSNSTIWGSEAMGGVLAITTSGRDGGDASLEYGGPRTLYAQASAGHSTGPLTYALDAGLLDSGGISAVAGGSEPDGLREWQAGGHVEAALGEGLRMLAALRQFDARLDLDGYPPPDYAFADTAEWQRTRRTSASAGLDYSHDGLLLRTSWSLADTSRESHDPAFGTAPSYTTHGRDERAEIRGKWDIGEHFDLHFGAEREWSWVETLFDARMYSQTTGAYAQAGLRFDTVVLNAGLRVDDHDRFGTAWSVGADGAVELGDGWRVRASYGEGFKAPTLFQLLSDYGNTLLRPENSRGFDVGIEKNFRDANPFFAISAFRRDSTDLIDFISCFGVSDGICAGRPYGTYDNVGLARAQGLELEGAASFGELRLQGAYSYVEAVNRTPGAANEGNDLARRPRHALSLSADWTTPLAGLALGADLRVVSASFDDAANLVPLAGYALGTLRASLPLTSEIELYGRIENVWDQKYQTVAGYGTQGRSAYLGARARW